MIWMDGLAISFCVGALSWSYAFMATVRPTFRRVYRGGPDVGLIVGALQNIKLPDVGLTIPDMLVKGVEWKRLDDGEIRVMAKFINRHYVLIDVSNIKEFLDGLRSSKKQA